MSRAKQDANVSRMKKEEQEDEQDVQEEHPALTPVNTPKTDAGHPVASALQVLIDLLLKKKDFSDEEKKRRIEEEREKLAKHDLVKFDRVRESMERIRAKNKPALSQKNIDAAKHAPVRRQVDSDLPTPAP